MVYAINTLDITDMDLYKVYVKAVKSAFMHHGGAVVCRAATSHYVEGEGRQSVSILRFSTMKQAKAYYASVPYRNALKAYGQGFAREVRLVETE